MPDIIPPDFSPLIGTPHFFHALLSHIRGSTPGPLPLDPVIFQAILLCIIVGDKHLILHTPEEDINLVARLVVWTLSSIFGLQTHRTRIKPKPAHLTRSGDANFSTNSTQFLRSLFLRLGNDDVPNVTSKSKSTAPRSDETYSRIRPRTVRPKSSPYTRSISFPNDLPSTTHPTRSGPSDAFVDQTYNPPASASDQHRTSIPSIKSPRPIYHAHTEPPPIRQSSAQLEFPHALVISGIENASTSEQRSLAQVLAEKRVTFNAPLNINNSYTQQADSRQQNRRSNGDGNATLDSSIILDDDDYNGTWTAPEGFITVYVCPWNARERPNIHKSLLDRFAMSTTVLVRQSIRQAFRALPFSSAHVPLHGHSQLYSHSNPGTPTPFIAAPLPQSQTPPFLTHPLPSVHHNAHRFSQTTQPINVLKQVIPHDLIHLLQRTWHHVYLSPTLSLYLADLFSAARHHPQLEGTLLTVRAMKDAEDLARAGRVLGVDPTGSELIRNTNNHNFENDEREDDQNSFREYDEITDEIGSGSALIEGLRSPTYLDPKDKDRDLDRQDYVQSHHVSEADIARIIPRVITHRLRVRNGPEEEILGSAIFGATFQDTDGGDLKDGNDYKWDTRNTVKDILISILAEV